MLLKLIKIVHVSFLMLYLCIFLLCLCLEVVVSFFISIEVDESLCSQTCSSSPMLSAKLLGAAASHHPDADNFVAPEFKETGRCLLGPMTHIFSLFWFCVSFMKLKINFTNFGKQIYIQCVVFCFLTSYCQR